TTPFTRLGDSGFSIDLSNAELETAVIRIGPESIDLKSLPASPQVVPWPLATTATFAPRYAVGNPNTAGTTPAVTSTTVISDYSQFPGFVDQVIRTMTAANPAVQFEARGFYNRSTNIFTASSISLVL
ncbi:MAG: hypothetical protein WBF21_16250, partial [Steroidobacteraceae bacterium]